MTDIQEKIDGFLSAAQDAVSTTGEGWDEGYADGIVNDLSNHLSAIHPELGSLIKLSVMKMTIVIFNGSQDSNGACSEALKLLFDTDKSVYDELEFQRVTNLSKVIKEFTALDSEWKARLNQLVRQSGKAILISATPWLYYESQSISIDGFSESYVRKT